MSSENTGDAEPHPLVLLPVVWGGILVGGAVAHLLLYRAVPGNHVALTELLVSVGGITAGMTAAMVVADACSEKTWSSGFARELAAAVGAVALGVVLTAAFFGYVLPWDAGTAIESIVLVAVASAAAVPFLARARSEVRRA